MGAVWSAPCGERVTRIPLVASLLRTCAPEAMRRTPLPSTRIVIVSGVGRPAVTHLSVIVWPVFVVRSLLPPPVTVHVAVYDLIAVPDVGVALVSIHVCVC
jgi:hypothetical protein